MPKKIGRNDREKQLRDKKIRPGLKSRGWMVRVTHGNKYMAGFPDLYLSHVEYGNRWVDVKVEGDYEFTRKQKLEWPIWHQNGSGVWIMTDWNEAQYARLFKLPNWLDYWKPKYGDPFHTKTPIDIMREEGLT